MLKNVLAVIGAGAVLWYVFGAPARSTRVASFRRLGCPLGDRVGVMGRIRPTAGSGSSTTSTREGRLDWCADWCAP